MRKGKLALVLCLVGATLMTTGLHTSLGLSDEEIFRRLRFSFIIPGGRSLALGGAFIAEGDDATAAASNPAALHYVYKQGFFVEYRSTSIDSEVFRPSRTVDPPVITDPPQTYLDMQLVDKPEDVGSLAFASYVIPFSLGGKRARIAFSRQMLLDLKTSLSDGAQTTRASFGNPSFPSSWISGGEVVPYTVDVTSMGSLDAQITQWNLAFSYSFMRDFSLGITASRVELDMQMRVSNQFEDPLGVLHPGNPRIYNQEGLAENFASRSFIDDSDVAYGYTVGLHWHPDSVYPSGYSPWRFGVVYRRGADLEVSEHVELASSMAAGASVEESSFDNELKVPDRYGIGISYHAKSWLFTVDGERIKYSDLMKGFEAGVNALTNPTTRETWQGAGQADPPSYTVDDATVFHGGVEYFHSTRRDWTHAFRMGYYNEPDSRVRLTLMPGATADTEAIYKDAFRGGEEEDHFTAGYELRTPGGLEIHLAGDFGDTSTTVVVSTVYSFGKVR